MEISRTLGDVAQFLNTTTESPDVVINSIGIDSRTLGQRGLWIARQGRNTHGAQHRPPHAVAAVTDAIGASILRGSHLPILIVEDPTAVLGDLAAWFFGYPARDMTMWAVTGTNGKTTVTHILEHALTTLHRRSGIIGTLGARGAGQEFPLARTTPEAPDIQTLLYLMRKAGVSDVAMEVSSHALALGRVDGLRFDVAIFTNLSQDHLDFHESMEHYFAAKASLFTQQRAKRAVINVDNAWGTRLVAQTQIPVLTYGSSNQADVQVTVDQQEDVMTVMLSHAGETYTGSAALIGEFNAVNIAAAFAALISTGCQADSAFAAVIGAEPVPGRMEVVHHKPMVVVDYAHTPEAVEIVLDALRPHAARLLTVMGCGGDRDPAKRPLMGDVAARKSDVLIVTDDNPRSEAPANIRAQVLTGTRNGAAAVSEIGDRRSAIFQAVAQARSQDVIAILGKGAEQGQEVAGEFLPFDDRVVAREAVRERMSS